MPTTPVKFMNKVVSISIESDSYVLCTSQDGLGCKKCCFNTKGVDPDLCNTAKANYISCFGANGNCFWVSASEITKFV